MTSSKNDNNPSQRPSLPVDPVSSGLSSASTAPTAFTASTAFPSTTALPSSKVLIVTYYWPPSGGAGVQRWLKFAKFLPEFGWEPLILTIDPDFAAYPVTDSSLAADVPDDLRVFKTRATDYFSIYKKDRSKIPSAGFANSVNNTLTGKILRFIRGNFFLPDPRKGWNSFAFKKACELISSEGIKHVITTSPPHSTQLIGLRLKKKFPGIKWITDLRDPWTDIYYYEQFYPTLLSKFIDSQLEKKVLKNADTIITVGETLKKHFAAKEPEAERKTTVIHNGFDEEDFKDIKAAAPSRFTLTYVGTLSDIYPVEGLLEALKKMQTEGRDFILRFVGTVSPNSMARIKSSLPERNIEIIPYAKHNEAIGHMVNSSILLLIIPSHKSNKSIITGKLFEYLGSGRPVLCIGPSDGDAAHIIEQAAGGKTVDYYNSEAAGSYIREIMNNSYSVQNSGKIRFSRRNITGQLAEVIG